MVYTKHSHVMFWDLGQQGLFKIKCYFVEKSAKTVLKQELKQKCLVFHIASMVPDYKNSLLHFHNICVQIQYTSAWLLDRKSISHKTSLSRPILERKAHNIMFRDLLLCFSFTHKPKNTL